MSDPNAPLSASFIARITGRIVSAYVTNNRVDRLRLGDVVNTVSRSLAALAADGKDAAQVTSGNPAVPIKQSVTPDYLVCLEDGARLKMLKRHLRMHHGLTPLQYREKWALTPDYPVVAPNYAKKRSALAREIGLGGPANKAQRKPRR